MNVLLNTSWWGTTMEVPRHTRALAFQLAERGHGVTVLVQGKNRDLESPETNPALFLWPGGRPSGPRDVLLVRRLLRERAVDCILSLFEGVSLLTVLGFLQRVPLRIAWYQTLLAALDAEGRTPRWKLRLLVARKSLVYRAATHLVAVSEASRRDLVAEYGVPEDKIRVFHNSLSDPLREHELTEEPRSRRVVCVGSFTRNKGQDVLVDAVGRILSELPDLEVHFVGEGPRLAAVRERAQRLGLGDACRFHGILRRPEIFRHMKAASLTVVPSRHEAFGHVVVESLAVGTPVVGSRTGGIAEIVRDGTDGLLVPPGDSAALAQALRTLLGDPALRQRMGAAARRRYESAFSREKLLAAQIEWLESLDRAGRAASLPRPAS